jgi:hypothetical protein
VHKSLKFSGTGRTTASRLNPDRDVVPVNFTSTMSQEDQDQAHLLLTLYMLWGQRIGRATHDIDLA